jgi:hypothetical protein
MKEYIIPTFSLRVFNLFDLKGDSVKSEELSYLVLGFALEERLKAIPKDKRPAKDYHKYPKVM